MASVVDQTPYNEYTADGVATVYPYEFQLLDAADLVVTVNGVVVPSSDFTLSGVGVQAGGDVTFDVAPLNGQDVLLSREIALERQIDYQNNGDLKAATVNLDFNRIWQALQGAVARIGGAIRLPYPEQTDELPAPADRAGKVLGFDAVTGGVILITQAVGSAGALAAQLASSIGTTFLGWLRNLPGAVASTLYAWLQRQEVDVEEFGAVGDGVTNDRAAILAALNSGAKIVHMRAKSYRINAPTIPVPNGVRLIGQGKASTFVPLGSNFTPFSFTDTDDTGIEHLCVVAHATQTAHIFRIEAATRTVARNLVKSCQVSGSGTDFPIFKLLASGAGCGIWGDSYTDISASGCGTLVDIETTGLNSWTNSHTVDFELANDYVRGIVITKGATAADGCSDSTFAGKLQTSARTVVAGITIPDSVVGVNRRNDLRGWRAYDLPGGCSQHIIGTGVDRTNIDGPTGDDIVAAKFSDHGLNTNVPGQSNYYARLRGRGRFLHVPTVTGWTSALIGSATEGQFISYGQSRTGVTNPSTARAYTEVFAGLNGSAGANVLTIDFGKEFVLGFSVSRIGSNAAAVGRFQFKQTNAAGPLAAAGLGIQINNLAVTGESYGSALGGVALGNFTDTQSYYVEIRHYPGSRVEFWINNQYVAQQTDLTRVPSGTVACQLVRVLGNNSAADLQQLISEPWAWAEH